MLGGGSLGTTPTVFGEVVGKGKRKEGKQKENKQPFPPSQGDWSVYQVLAKRRV